MNRREFLGVLAASALSGLSALASDIAFSADSSSARAEANIPEPPPDFSLRTVPVKLELSPGHTITTVGYNGRVPGPLFRVREGQHVTIEVRNDSDVPELLHWHGLMVPSNVDGAMEEGTPTLFHCHMQPHQDLGFMTLVKYLQLVPLGQRG
jgi:FtsP/CotA-like multicopper oxidase with cupredoxin domain